MKDQLHRTIQLKEIPKRIVSLVPSQTELLCDLGLEEQIVGITKFCVHPIHLKNKKAIIGGTKQIHIDKIKALQPDIILCNKEENTLDIVRTCEDIAIVHVSDIYTIDDCLELISQYGEIFQVQTVSLKVINDIETKLKEFQSFIVSKPLVNVIYAIWKNPWMVAANNTFINHILELNKFNNIFSNLERYPEIEFNTINFHQIDLVLLSSEPFPFKEKHIQELKEQHPNVEVMLVDGEYFSWYGSRLKKAFNYFKDLRQNL